MKEKKVDIGLLWQQYKDTAAPELQEQLVEYYLPLVKGLAAKVFSKIHCSAEMDDLVSDGLFGLLRAIDGFELSRGFKFETYAIPVVRGAIYNGLRRMDWLPERTRCKARALQKAIDKFASISGRQPTEEELAEELKISAGEVFDLISCLGCVYLLSLDQPLNASDSSEGTIMDVVPADSSFSDPSKEFEFSEERSCLRSAIGKLDEREQFLIKMHYFNGVTFEKISRLLGVSKQRISQMHSRAVRRLRESLKEEDISSEAMIGFFV
ncbi:MAG: sigma-70 family RNA polymerase sigma factor [Candidatus Bruticola sp.]